MVDGATPQTLASSPLVCAVPDNSAAMVDARVGSASALPSELMRLPSIPKTIGACYFGADRNVVAVLSVHGYNEVATPAPSSNP